MWKAFDVTEFYFLWTSLFNMCSPCVSPLPWKEKDIHFMYFVESDFVINTCENHAQLTRLFLYPYSYLSFPLHPFFSYMRKLRLPTQHMYDIHLPIQSTSLHLFLSLCLWFAISKLLSFLIWFFPNSWNQHSTKEETCNGLVVCSVACTEPMPTGTTALVMRPLPKSDHVKTSERRVISTGNFGRFGGRFVPVWTS